MGARLLVVPIKPVYRPTPDARTLTVREIQVRVARAGHRGNHPAPVDQPVWTRPSRRELDWVDSASSLAMPPMAGDRAGGTWRRRAAAPQDSSAGGREVRGARQSDRARAGVIGETPREAVASFVRSSQTPAGASPCRLTGQAPPARQHNRAPVQPLIPRKSAGGTTKRPVGPSALSVLHHALCILHCAFCIVHFAFCIDREFFPAP